MKTLISLVTLVTIIATYIFSATLYMQDQFFYAYALVMTALTALTFWIKSLSAK